MAPAKSNGKARQRRPKTVGVAIGDGNVDTEFCVSSAAAGDARNIANGSSRKRKSSDGPTNGDAASSEPSEAHKKARLVTEHPSQKRFEPTRRTGADKSLLPPEVWHCIFKFCPPTTLGNLLRVNKLFNRYLDPSSRVLKPFPSVKHKGAVDALNPDVIWRESRKLFWPYMPSPLRSLSELEMWRLVCSSSCQNCGKHADRETVAQKKPHDPYHSGPGPNGVAVIWQFAVILCGSCLLEKTTKELDLLLSSTFLLALLPALPFVFSTRDLHVLPSDQLTNGTVLTKLFLKADVLALSKEFADIQKLGSGAIEEWTKGLDDRRRKIMQDASKFEQLQSSGGVMRMRQEFQPSRLSLKPAPAEANLPPKPPVVAYVARNEQPRQEANHLDAMAKETTSGRRASKAVDVTKVEPESNHRALEVTLATKKIAVEKEWTEAQRPLLAHIARIADDIIATKWDNGNRITEQFAVQVLWQVRKRFYADMARDEAKARAAGRELLPDPPEGPFTRKLTLENLRWLYEEKVRAHADRTTSTKFICHACKSTKTKPYVLDSVIQHYASKHTKTLSRGNVVVYWKAEWPETLMFSCKDDKKLPKKLQRKSKAEDQQKEASKKGQAASLPNARPQTQSLITSSQPVATSSSYPAPPQPPAFGNSTYVMPFSQASNFPAVEAYPQAGAFGVSYPPNYPAAQEGENYGPYSYGPSAAPLTVAAPGLPGYHFNSIGYPSTAFPAAVPTAPVGPLEDIARLAREAWNALSSYRDLPGAVRLFAVIHHVDKHHHQQYQHPLPLALFNEGLSNHKDMRPIRNVNALPCNTCQLGLGNASMVEKDRDIFSFPQLCNHFLHKHMEPMQAMPHLKPLEWTTDMLVLPDRSEFFKAMSNIKMNAILSDAYQLLPETSQPSLNAAAWHFAQPKGQSTVAAVVDGPAAPPTAQETTTTAATTSDRGQNGVATGKSGGSDMGKRNKQAGGSVHAHGPSRPEKEGLAEEAAQRKEVEEIRNMWAKDRAGFVGASASAKPDGQNTSTGESSEEAPEAVDEARSAHAHGPLPATAAASAVVPGLSRRERRLRQQEAHVAAQQRHQFTPEAFRHPQREVTDLTGLLETTLSAAQATASGPRSFGDYRYREPLDRHDVVLDDDRSSRPHAGYSDGRGRSRSPGRASPKRTALEHAHAYSTMQDAQQYEQHGQRNGDAYLRNARHVQETRGFAPRHPDDGYMVHDGRRQHTEEPWQRPVRYVDVPYESRRRPPFRPEYPPYQDGPKILYEIVEITDEIGTYVIQRPVLREGHQYPTYESLGPPSPVLYERGEYERVRAPRDHVEPVVVRPENQYHGSDRGAHASVDRDALYYREEYDPRFPATSMNERRDN